MDRTMKRILITMLILAPVRWHRMIANEAPTVDYNFATSAVVMGYDQDCLRDMTSINDHMNADELTTANNYSVCINED